MKIETVRNEALSLFNWSCSAGLNSSYRSCLESMYQTASKRKNYTKCSLIQDLITEDINS